MACVGALRLRLRPPRARRRGCSTARCAAAPPPREVLVVGGGAAGLTAAYFAAQAGARVTVLERNGECGKKILVRALRCEYRAAARLR
jgi:NADPH-dependent 2,4-dienoyl-CoA reductase/sulfur reductase-like enzyme